MKIKKLLVLEAVISFLIKLKACTHFSPVWKVVSSYAEVMPVRQVPVGNYAPIRWKFGGGYWYFPHRLVLDDVYQLEYINSKKTRSHYFGLTWKMSFHPTTSNNTLIGFISHHLSIQYFSYLFHIHCRIYFRFLEFWRY